MVPLENLPIHIFFNSLDPQIEIVCTQVIEDYIIIGQTAHMGDAIAHLASTNDADFLNFRNHPAHRLPLITAAPCGSCFCWPE